MHSSKSVFGAELPSMITRQVSKQTSMIGNVIELNFPILSQERRSSFLPLDLQSIPNLTGRFGDTSFLNTSLYSSHYLRKSTKIQYATYCTGSSYMGDFNSLGMAGKGIYRFPHGVIYDGHFNKNGEFHGTGILIYPNGQAVEGLWRNGKLTKNPTFVAADNSPYNRQYCKLPDRRFQIETQHYLAPAPYEFLTNGPNPPKKIPPNCYDAGEGFYDPKRNVLLRYSDLSVIAPLPKLWHDEDARDAFIKLFAPTPSQHSLLNKIISKTTESMSNKLANLPVFLTGYWIMNYCRKADDEPVGYAPKLYEAWTGGRKAEEAEWLIKEETMENISDIEIMLDKLSTYGQPQAQDQTSGQFYSFIRGLEDPRFTDDASLLALKTMFSTHELKYFIIKRAKIHYAKQKTKSKGRTKNKSLKQRTVGIDFSKNEINIY